MAEKNDSFDSVAQGPVPSDDGGTSRTVSGASLPPHPSVEALKGKFGEAVLHHEVVGGDEHVVFVEPDRSLEILTFLREDPGQSYDLLRDVTAVDYGGGRPIQVVYQLFSLSHQRALRVKCELSLDALEIESVFWLWKAANWLEREVYDLFGVTFKNHPDLRRILMPDDYAEGHPLRKDFPLRGRFSRAEQTRRALSQELDHYYIQQEILLGGEPQNLPPTVAELEAMEEERAAE